MRIGRDAAAAMVAERPGRVVAAVLLAVYAATLAPDVTFWDAGEFIAAAASFGIPHPPGTPLYVFLLTAFHRVTPFLGTAVATNLVSALCTAAACGVLARLLRRWTGDPLLALAGGLAAGLSATVWINATETEVYAVALALAAAALWAGDRLGLTGGRRWLALVAYLFVLAVPLHLSMLVVGPAVGWLAWTRADGSRRWGIAALLGAAWLGAMALGKMSWTAGGVALGALVVAVALRARADRVGVRRALRDAAAILLVGAIAASVLAAMLLRARHDPAINQGGAMTLKELSDAVARRQYLVSPAWPRLAPIWLQLANVFQYLDWQAALSLGPTVFPTVGRVGATVAWGLLALAGALAHRRLDRRSWRALLILLVAGSVGVMLYLNMRAGPSLGYGVIPAGTPREARERDYFYVFAFWVWSAWAGVGAVTLAPRLGRHGWVGVAVAALPLLGNWRSVDRSRGLEAELPRVWAVELLRSAPPNAVLFVGGDNDSYPLWYAQEALGVRRDVAMVTTPLLPAEWYRDEMWRRHRLYADSSARPWRGRLEAIAMMGERARALGRPIAAAVSLPAAERRELGRGWTMRGLVYVAGAGPRDTARVAPAVDTAVTRATAARVAAWRRGRQPVPAIDRIAELVLAQLECPARALAAGGAGDDEAASRSLDSTCNRR